MIVEIFENTCTLKYSIHIYCMFKDTPPFKKKLLKKNYESKFNLHSLQKKY